mmetsp:Transcript_77477/g.134244  ORF Transcript_77477/g.134244 Transcript_77477/m.134244 type:complete len:400 (-) Transcript_77477:84-1283(-)
MTSPIMQELHLKGECKPCAYFYAKADGCRGGADCSFCHLCPPTELKTRRKEKMKAMKKTRWEQQAAYYAWAPPQKTPLSSKAKRFTSAKIVPDIISLRTKNESSEPEPSPASSVNGEEKFDLAMPISPPPGLELPSRQDMEPECEREHQGSSGSEPEREQGTQDLSGEPSVDPEMQRAREVAAAGGGLSGHTTIMIRHIPSKYTQSKLMNEINSVGFDGTYDFFYLPIDTRNHGNRGFGFINFLSARLAEEFYSKYHGQKLKHFDATTPIAVMPADVQGFEESAERFFASGHLRKKKSHSEPVFLKPLPAHLREEGRRKGRTHARDSQGAAQKEKQKSSPAQIAHHVPLQMEAPHMPAMIGGPLGLPPSTMPPRFCGICGNVRVAGQNFCRYCGDLLCR